MATPATASTLALCAASLLLASVVHGQGAPQLSGVDVYGTDAFTAAELKRDHGAVLSLFARLAAGDVTEAAVERVMELRAELSARGSFAYLDFSLITSYGAEGPVHYLTVDVVEAADSARRMDFRPPPVDTVAGVDSLLAAWRAYEDRGFALMRSGELSPLVGECGALHCVFGFAHDSLRAFEELFSREVPAKHDVLAAVLERDAAPERRAAAAFLLAHDTVPGRVAEALLPAVRDLDGAVRNNAMRVLIALARREDVEIPVAPIADALDFPGTTDRNKAGYVLLGLAQRAAARPVIIEAAGPILLDMLELEQPNNHDPAYELLKLLSGRDYGERDYDAWRAWYEGATAGSTGAARSGAGTGSTEMNSGATAGSAAPTSSRAAR